MSVFVLIAENTHSSICFVVAPHNHQRLLLCQAPELGARRSFPAVPSRMEKSEETNLGMMRQGAER